MDIRRVCGESAIRNIRSSRRVRGVYITYVQRRGQWKAEMDEINRKKNYKEEQKKERSASNAEE